MAHAHRPWARVTIYDEEGRVLRRVKPRSWMDEAVEVLLEHVRARDFADKPASRSQSRSNSPIYHLMCTQRDSNDFPIVPFWQVRATKRSSEYLPKLVTGGCSVLGSTGSYTHSP